MDFILELIFKGLLQWLFDMIINIAEYLANSLLTIFSMDLDYFEANIPITSDVVNIMICTGWALLLGNLVFQGLKSMVTGLGIEGEDPQMLFTRTFVMSFFLVASRQVCDIGLSITKRVITLLQVPTVVQPPQLSEADFDVPGDAGWLLVIIIGVILIIQIIKLFFEIGERYVIVAVLTILAPLAFAMGGSKNTSDIFKGWVRMFASMCLMMVLSVVFLKFVLSAMSDVPSGAAVLPWTIFIVAIAKTGRKVDGIIARIGLSPAITGDPLGHSRLPGMLTLMVVRSMAKDIGKSAAASKNSNSNSGASRMAFSSAASRNGSVGAAPLRPPIGSSAGRDSTAHTSASAPATASLGGSSGGHSSGGATKTSGVPSYKDVSHTPTSSSGKETLHTPGSTFGKDAGAATAAKSTATSTAPTRPGITKPPSKETASGHMPSGKPVAISDVAIDSSVDTAKTTTPTTARPTADIKSSDNSKTGAAQETARATAARLPLADKIRSASLTTDKTGGAITSRAESAKTAKDSLSEAGKAVRPTRPSTSPTGTHKQSVTPVSRSSDASITNKSGDVNQKGGSVSQSQSSATNVTVNQKGTPNNNSRPDAATARNEHGRPPISKMPNISKASGNIGAESTKPPFQPSASTNVEASQSVQPKGFMEQGARGGKQESYKTASSRPDNAETANVGAASVHATKGPSETRTSRATATTNTSTSKNTSVNNSASTQTDRAISPPPVSQRAQSRPNVTGNSNARHESVKSAQTQPAPHSRANNNTTTHSTGLNNKKQTSIKAGAEDKDGLQNRPPYKPDGVNKQNRKGGSGVNERQK